MFAIKHIVWGALLAATLGFSAHAAKADGFVSVGYSYAPAPVYYTPAPVYYTTPVYVSAPTVVYRPPVYCPPIYYPPVYCPPIYRYDPCQPVRIYTPYRDYDHHDRDYRRW